MENSPNSIEFFFKKLSHISTLKGTAESIYNGKKIQNNSQASVNIKLVDTNTLIYTEEGFWTNPAVNFKNTLRWTIDKQNKKISLEHLRRGNDKAVLLFYFVLNGSNKLTALAPHLCAPDTYTAEIKWSNAYIDYQCRVSGPKKDQLLTYHYE